MATFDYLYQFHSVLYHLWQNSLAPIKRTYKHDIHSFYWWGKFSHWRIFRGFLRFVFQSYLKWGNCLTCFPALHTSYCNYFPWYVQLELLWKGQQFLDINFCNLLPCSVDGWKSLRHSCFSWKRPVLGNRKSFKTQSKLTFWSNKKFLKPYELLKLFPEKIELDFGHGPCWLSFCPNIVLKEQFLKVLPIFFQDYSIIR